MNCLFIYSFFFQSLSLGFNKPPTLRPEEMELHSEEAQQMAADAEAMAADAETLTLRRTSGGGLWPFWGGRFEGKRGKTR